MARKTVRVDIPRTNPDDMLTLMDSIKKENTNQGANSPLKPKDAQGITDTSAKAQSIRDKAKEFEAKAETQNQEAREIFGINKNQGVDTPNTGLFFVASVRDTLLNEYRGNEEKLSEWGLK